VHKTSDGRRLGAGLVESRGDRIDDALRLIVGCRWRLRRDQAVAIQEGGVGERAADVYAEEHRRAR
jgi:hypothetical protein